MNIEHQALRDSALIIAELELRLDDLKVAQETLLEGMYHDGKLYYRPHVLLDGQVGLLQLNKKKRIWESVLLMKDKEEYLNFVEACKKHIVIIEDGILFHQLGKKKKAYFEGIKWDILRPIPDDIKVAK